MNEIEKESAETNDDRGMIIKPMELLRELLIRQGVILIEDKQAEGYNALSCVYCGQNQVIGNNASFECLRCGCLNYERVKY